MDKLSEYLPLLIILVTLIFSVIRKKGKIGKIIQDTTLQKDSIEEFFEEKKLAVLPRRTVADKPKKQELRKPETGVGKISASFSQTSLIQEQEEDEGFDFSFEDEEDTKRAIIYSEIINRKNTYY